MRELISTQKKKAQAGNELLIILPKSSHARGKKMPPHPDEVHCLRQVLAAARQLLPRALLPVAVSSIGKHCGLGRVECVLRSGVLTPVTKPMTMES